MNEELYKFAMGKVWILIAGWIAMVGVNTILMAVAFDCGLEDLSTFISLTLPVLIILFGLLWFKEVKAKFEKIEKLQVADDTEQMLSKEETE